MDHTVGTGEEPPITLLTASACNLSGEGTTEIRRHPSAARAFKALVSEEPFMVPFCPEASSESVRTTYSYCVGRVGEQA